MPPSIIQSLLSRGEGIEVEFKEAFFELPRSTFETVCAFLNRRGGHLLLGVKDNGQVEGVLESEAARMVAELTTNANNGQKLSSPFYLSPEVVLYEGKTLIYCYVPQSSQLHRTAGRIFDRTAADGDIDITAQPHSVTQLYLRKQQTYTENRIYPFAQLSDFRPDLIKRVRTMAANQRTGHPWAALSDEELLQSAGLRLRDVTTGQEGYTLAALLLLGKDEVILSALPHHKTDALLRVRNLDRYDDRDDIRTNLIESYDRLMAFTAKHLPDPFYLEGTQRVSLRDKIFREVVANLLVHREFANAYPAKFIIERDGVHTENWNLPHAHGLLQPGQFTPFPKNPVIARFFKEIGLVDELGSGLRNTFRYVPEYSGGKQPQFVEEDVFRCFIPAEIPIIVNISAVAAGTSSMTAQLGVQVTDQGSGGGSSTVTGDNDTLSRIRDTINDTVNDTVSDTVKRRITQMIDVIRERPGLRSPDLAKQLGVTEITIRRDVQKVASLVQFKGSPKSGGYVLTEIMLDKLRS